MNLRPMTEREIREAADWRAEQARLEGEMSKTPKLRDRDLSGQIGDGRTVLSLLDAVQDLRDRMGLAEGALRSLDFEPCTSCGRWVQAHWGKDGVARGLHVIGIMPAEELCFDCVKAKLERARDEDGSDWDDLTAPDVRGTVLDQLAEIVLRFPALVRIADDAMRQGDADLGLAWMAAKSRASARLS